MKDSTVKKVVFCILPIIGALLAVGFMLGANNKGFSDVINIIVVI